MNVRVNRIALAKKGQPYTVTGALCALAGIINAGLLSTAATNAGQGSELDVIAAVVAMIDAVHEFRGTKR